MGIPRMTAILDPKLAKGIVDVNKFESEIKKALKEEANEIHKLYKLFYGTWKGSQDHARPGNAIPNMPKRVKVTGSDAYAEVSTRGHEGEYGNKKLAWIEYGTSVRWATLSPDWVSKTGRGRIRSWSGSGRVLAAGKAKTYMSRRGKPGLEARNVSEQIADERKLPFNLAIDEAIERAIR